jgi:hypothetical protein
MLQQQNPDAAAELLRRAQADVETRWKVYEQLAHPNGKEK